MSIAEYYYPLATLDVRTQNDKTYFIDASNIKINFAMKSDADQIEGSAIEYYIQPISDDADKIKFGMATNYLVIKHKIAVTPPVNFYVAVPLYIARTGEDISKHIKNDRINGRLAQSFNNLNKATRSVQFSLESVINSMKSFAPNGYYKLADKNTNAKIYVLNKPIHVKYFNTESFYKGDVIIPPILSELTKATINRVKVTRTCSKPESTKKRTCEPMFYGLGKKQQVRIDYLNLIYGLMSLIFLFIFYYIYEKYLTGERQTVLYGMLLALALVVIPIGSTKGIYESKKGIINVSDLQHSIIFARYFILTILCSLVMLIGVTNIKSFLTNNLNYDAVRLMMRNIFNNWTKEKWINLLILILSWFLISSSIYIFVPSPNECLL